MYSVFSQHRIAQSVILQVRATVRNICMRGIPGTDLGVWLLTRGAIATNGSITSIIFIKCR